MKKWQVNALTIFAIYTLGTIGSWIGNQATEEKKIKEYQTKFIIALVNKDEDRTETTDKLEYWLKKEKFEKTGAGLATAIFRPIYLHNFCK